MSYAEQVRALWPGFRHFEQARLLIDRARAGCAFRVVFEVTVLLGLALGMVYLLCRCESGG
jgi:hypothetical protein